jgi:hypothetical protein
VNLTFQFEETFFVMYKLILVVFLGVLYNSLTVEAQVFSPCPHATAYVCDDQLDTDSVCLVIFNGSNPNNGTIDPKCQNSSKPIDQCVIWQWSKKFLLHCLYKGLRS